MEVELVVQTNEHVYCSFLNINLYLFTNLTRFPDDIGHFTSFEGYYIRE